MGTLSSHKLLFFIFLVSFSLYVHSKTIGDTEALNRFDRKSWSYLTKFAVGQGQGTFRTKAQFTKALHNGDGNTVRVNILAYPGDDWYRARDLTDCKEKENWAKIKIPLDVPGDASWGESVQGLLEQGDTQVWFFVLSDCDKNLSPHIIGNRLRWEIEALNSDGSHFSEDEQGMILPLFVNMMVIASFFVLNSIKFYNFYSKEESADYPTLITIVALFIEFLSLFCEVIHLTIYAYNGQGSAFFNFSNHVLSITSQFLITCLLLLIAYGWSINFLEFEDMDVFIPLGILLGIMHIVIIGVGKIIDNEHYKYHDYENWAGVVIIVVRLLLYVFWIYLFAQSYTAAKHTEKKFFKKFGIFASIYFLAFPVLVIFSTFFVSAHSKHKLVTTGTLLLQTLTLVVLTLVFTTKKSQYYQISLKGKTLLPTNKLL